MTPPSVTNVTIIVFSRTSGRSVSVCHIQLCIQGNDNIITYTWIELLQPLDVDEDPLDELGLLDVPGPGPLPGHLLRALVVGEGHHVLARAARVGVRGARVGGSRGEELVRAGVAARIPGGRRVMNYKM